MALSTRTFRVFVSSTFSDLKAERNALQEKVFPRLEKLAKEHGCRFQSIDLRWGVSEEAALNQQTMKVCLDEIYRCQMISPRPNFIILLGNRYGWRPLPYEIQSDEFNRVFTHIPKKDRSLILVWYQRDNNSIPPEYILQPRTGKYVEHEIWEPVEIKLHELLETAAIKANLPEADLIKYTTSATEQEIIQGAIQVTNAREHIFCFVREINCLPQNITAQGFADLEQGKLDARATKRLTDLKHRLKDVLGEKNCHQYEASWEKSAPTLTHLDQLCDDVYNELERVILGEVNALQEVDPLERESIAHETFGEELTLQFLGRANILKQIDGYLLSNNKQPLVVWGTPGSGKSALMAKAAQLTKEDSLSWNIIQRFIGVTPDSSTGRALLENLCQQITYLYDANENNIPSSYNELVTKFPRYLGLATEEKPLVVFLDALDQLSDADDAHLLGWLPAILPPYTKLVVSILPGECKDTLEQKIPSENFFELLSMPLEEGKALLNIWLDKAMRTLQPKQRADILEKYERCKLPLYLKLAFEEARHWRSYDGLPSYEGMPGLAETVPGIIQNLLWRLSQPTNHGKMLVSRTLGYLVAAKYGLSEDELLDVLSLDKEIIEDFLIRSPKSPKISQLPFVVWSRLYFDLQLYLIERRIDDSLLMTFYHQQLGEVIRNKYLSGNQKTKRHQILTKYFANQPLFIDKNEQEIINLRKFTELPYQMSQTKSWQQLYTLLAKLPFFDTFWKVNQYDVKIYWAKVEANSELRLVEAYRRVLEAPEKYSGYAWELATLMHDTGHGPESLILRQFLVEHYRRSGDIQRLVGALGNLAALYHDLGNLDEALLLLREQERLSRELFDVKTLAGNLGNQALIFGHIGELDRAQVLHQQEKSLCIKLGDRDGMARSIGNQGMVMVARGDLDGAMALFQEQERVYRDLGNRYGMARSIGNQGTATLRRGDLEGALILFGEQERICRELGDRDGLARALGNRGIILKRRGELDDAMRLFEETERIFRELGYKDGLADALGNQALIRRAHGEFDNAMTLFKEQEHLYRELGDNEHLAGGLGNQALVLCDQGKMAQAMTLLKEQERICRDLGNKDGLQRSLGNQANILSTIGDPDGALTLHREKERLCRELNDPKGLAIALANQASILGRLGSPRQALSLAEEAVQLLNGHGLTRVARQIQPILEELRLQLN